MSLMWGLLKKSFLISVSFEAKSFEKSLMDPTKSQQKVLHHILGSFKLNATDLEDFQKKFPIIGEEQIANLESRLSKADIVAFETTSGSSGKPKNIPYTKNLMASFHHMFRLWAWDVLTNFELNSGRFFFSISPQVKESDLSEDSDYLQATMRWLMKPFWSVDASAVRNSKPLDFMKELTFQLLCQRDLEIISVWSPTYLLTILNYVRVYHREWSKNSSIPQSSRLALENPNFTWEQVWPNLKFISSWGSAMAQIGYADLKSQFKNVSFQRKGLLATEAPLTIPWSKANGFVPLLQDIFFEFLDDSGQIFQLEDLQIGKIYEVIITTPGGLLRYQIGDLVQVTGRYHKTPTLEFVGRAGDICDLAGEKISEGAVRELLSPLYRELGFYVLIPSPIDSRYVLLSETSSTGLNEKADLALRKIFHYEVARMNSQLKIIEHRQISNLRGHYYKWMETRGVRFGDIKEKALLAKPELAANFLKFLNIETQPSLPSDQDCKA